MVESVADSEINCDGGNYSWRRELGMTDNLFEFCHAMGELLQEPLAPGQ